MSHKLKALGLGLVAMLAMGAFGVVSVGASGDGHTGGHFVSEVERTTIVGLEEPGTEHNLLFSTNGGEAIDCTVSTYHGEAVSETMTVTEVTLTPNYEECDTKESLSAPYEVDVIENSCDFTFTVNTESATTHNAVHIEGCTDGDHGKGIEIHHPNCIMRIPEQTVTGVVYKTGEVEGKHAITIESTTHMDAHYEEGTCRFFFDTGPQTGEMNGSVTVQGSIQPVGITATG